MNEPSVNRGCHPGRKDNYMVGTVYIPRIDSCTEAVTTIIQNRLFVFEGVVAGAY